MPETSAPMRVGFIGFGTIGQRVAQLVREQAPEQIDIVVALVSHPDKPRAAGSPRCVATVEELLSAEPEVVVEAGGHEALRSYGAAVLRAGCDLIMVSVGAFGREGLLQ